MAKNPILIMDEKENLHEIHIISYFSLQVTGHTYLFFCDVDEKKQSEDYPVQIGLLQKEKDRFHLTKMSDDDMILVQNMIRKLTKEGASPDLLESYGYKERKEDYLSGDALLIGEVHRMKFTKESYQIYMKNYTESKTECSKIAKEEDRKLKKGIFLFGTCLTIVLIILMILVAILLLRKPEQKQQPSSNLPEQLSPTYQIIKTKENQYGLAKLDGTVTIKPDYKEEDGQIPLIYLEDRKTVIVKKDGKMGLYKADGGVLLSNVYDEITYDPLEKRYTIKKGDSTYTITEESQVSWISKYQYLGPLQQDRILAKKGESWGYLDKDGKEVIPFQYLVAHDFSKTDAFALVQVSKTEWAYIDSSGKELKRYDANLYQPSNFQYGYAVIEVKQSKQKVAIDTKGKEVVHFTGEQLLPINKKDAFLIKTDTNYGILDATGKELIPAVYQSLNYQSDSIIIAKKDGKYGVIDINQKEVIAFLYDHLALDGLVSTKPGTFYRYVLEGKVGVLTKEGKELVPALYNTNDQGKDVGIWLYHDLYGVFSTLEKEFTLVDQNKKQLLYLSGTSFPKKVTLEKEYLCLIFPDRKEYYNNKGEKVYTATTMVIK